jgi:hypothetical protein
MALILLTGITHVNANLKVAEQSKQLLTELAQEITCNYDEQTCEQVISSAAYVILDESILELIKNSLDAGATKLEIKLANLDKDSNAVSFAITDNGRGFPTEKLGIYPTSREVVGLSIKAGDSTTLGGCNIGLLQASYALSRNEGKLLCENIVDRSGEQVKVTGAKLIFTSSLSSCCYTIPDYQTEQSTSRPKSSPVSAISPEQITFLLGSSFNAKLANRKRSQTIGAGSTGGSDSNGHLSPLPLNSSFDGALARAMVVSSPYAAGSDVTTPASDVAGGSLPGALSHNLSLVSPTMCHSGMSYPRLHSRLFCPGVSGFLSLSGLNDERDRTRGTPTL